MTITRVGSTEEYAKGWETAFGGAGKGTTSAGPGPSGRRSAVKKAAPARGKMSAKKKGAASRPAPPAKKKAAKKVRGGSKKKA